MKDHIQEYKYKKNPKHSLFRNNHNIIITSQSDAISLTSDGAINPVNGNVCNPSQAVAQFSSQSKTHPQVATLCEGLCSVTSLQQRSINQSINQSICRLISFTHSLHYNFEGREDSYSLHSLSPSLSLSVCDRIYWIRLKNTLIRLDIGRHARQMQYIRRANSAVTVYHRNALNRSTRVFNRLPLYFSTKPHHHSVKVASLSPSLFPSLFQLSNTSHWKCSKRKVYAFPRVSNDIASSSVIFIRHGFFPVKYFLDVYNWERLV